MFKKIIFSLISLISASIFCWNAYSFFSAPVIEFAVDRQIDDIKQRIERELLRSATPQYLTPKIRSALASVPADWTSIDMLREFGEEHSIVLPQELLYEIKVRETKERGISGAYDDCLQCMIDSESCPIGIVKICDIALELTPAGDVRSIDKAVSDWQAGQPVDTFDVSLATIGLVATAASFVTGGAAYAVKAGTGIMKAAKKAESIGKPLWRFIGKNTKGMIDFSRIPKNWHVHPGAIGQALDMGKYAKLKSFVSDVGSISSNVGTLKTLRIMKFIDSGKDAHRAKLATDALKGRASKAFEVIGKNRMLKQTFRINPKITRMAGATIGFVGGLIGLFWAAILKMLMALLSFLGGRFYKSFSKRNQAEAQA